MDRIHAIFLHFLMIQRENRDTSLDSSIPMRLPTQHFRSSICLPASAYPGHEPKQQGVARFTTQTKPGVAKGGTPGERGSKG